MRTKYQIPDTTGLVTTTVSNTKIKEVDNKIPDFSGLVKKADYDAKISDIGKQYSTTSDYNKFTNNILDVKILKSWLMNLVFLDLY